MLRKKSKIIEEQEAPLPEMRAQDQDAPDLADLADLEDIETDESGDAAFIPDYSNEEEEEEIEEEIEEEEIEEEEIEEEEIEEEEEEASLFNHSWKKIARFNLEAPKTPISALLQFFPKIMTDDPLLSELVLVTLAHVKDYAYKRRMGTVPEADSTFTHYVKCLKKLPLDSVIIPHVSGEDAADTLLAHSDLSHGDFRGCIFEGLHFRQVNFSYVNFRDSVLHAVTLTDCNCKRLDLRGADIAGLVADADTNAQAQDMIIDITDLKRAVSVNAIPRSLAFHNAIIDPNYTPFREEKEIDVDIMLVPCKPEDVKAYLQQRAEGTIPGSLPFNTFVRSHKNIHEEESVVVMADLSALDFPRHGIKNLAGANFSESILTNVNLTGCDLTRTNFSYTNMENAELRNVSASHACFDSVSGRFMRITDSHLEGASFKFANLAYAEITSSTLEQVRGDYANFSYTKWSPKAPARAAGEGQNEGRGKDYVSLSHAKMPYSNFRFAKGLYLSLEHAQFKSAHFDGCHLDYVNGSHAHFDRATMRYFITNNSVYSHTSFSRARADYAEFRQHPMSSSHHTEQWMHLDHANFSHAHLDMAVFSGQNASHANFSNIKADQLRYLDCVLEGADFHNASLRGGLFYETPPNYHPQQQSMIEYIQAAIDVISLKKREFAHKNLLQSHDDRHKKADKINAINANFDRVRFENMSFKHAHFEFSSMMHCKITHCDFSNSYFMHSNAKCSHWSHSLLNHMDASYAVFEGGAFHASNLSFMQAVYSNFRHAKLFDSLLHNTHLLHADFQHAHFRRCKIEKILGTDILLTLAILRDNDTKEAQFLAAQNEFEVLHSIKGKCQLFCYSMMVASSNMLGGLAAGVLIFSGLRAFLRKMVFHLENSTTSIFIQGEMPSAGLLIASVAGALSVLLYHREMQPLLQNLLAPILAHTPQKQSLFSAPPSSKKSKTGEGGEHPTAREETTPLTSSDAKKLLAGVKLFEP